MPWLLSENNVFWLIAVMRSWKRFIVISDFRRQHTGNIKMLCHSKSAEDLLFHFLNND